MLHLDREGTEEDGLLSDGQSPAIPAEDKRSMRVSPRQGGALAYARIPAPAAVQCAWCERPFDRAFQFLELFLFVNSYDNLLKAHHGAHPASKISGAGDGNRTRDQQLGRL